LNWSWLITARATVPLTALIDTLRNAFKNGAQRLSYLRSLYVHVLITTMRIS